MVKWLYSNWKNVKSTIYKCYNAEKFILKIKNSKYNQAFKCLVDSTKVNTSKEEPIDLYYVNHGAKVRYIDPLFNGNRMSKECKIAKKMIDKNLLYDMNKYVYIDKRLNILK